MPVADEGPDADQDNNINMEDDLETNQADENWVYTEAFIRKFQAINDRIKSTRRKRESLRGMMDIIESQNAMIQQLQAKLE